MKTKFLQMLLILILQISVASPAIAQAPRPPVTPPTPFPSRIELIVSKIRDNEVHLALSRFASCYTRLHGCYKLLRR
jgi:hypothetical protein